MVPLRLTREPRALRRPAGEGLTAQKPESAFCRIENLRAVTREAETLREPVGVCVGFRAPFRLLSARAPRQAVLGASFRLAPSLVTRPCSPAADKTRDASDRHLPPERTACTRTSRVPGSLSRLSPRGRHTEFGLRVTLRGTRRFTTSETASADRHSTRFPRGPSCGGASSVGVFYPRRRLRSSLWHSCRSRRFASRFSRLRASPACCTCGSETPASRRDHRDHLPVKGCGS
jgi:hypothetical protein